MTSAALTYFDLLPAEIITNELSRIYRHLPLIIGRITGLVSAAVNAAESSNRAELAISCMTAVHYLLQRYLDEEYDKYDVEILKAARKRAYALFDQYNFSFKELISAAVNLYDDDLLIEFISVWHEDYLLYDRKMSIEIFKEKFENKIDNTSADTNIIVHFNKDEDFIKAVADAAAISLLVNYCEFYINEYDDNDTIINFIIDIVFRYQFKEDVYYVIFNSLKNFIKSDFSIIFHGILRKSFNENAVRAAGRIFKKFNYPAKIFKKNNKYYDDSDDDDDNDNDRYYVNILISYSEELKNLKSKIPTKNIRSFMKYFVEAGGVFDDKSGVKICLYRGIKEYLTEENLMLLRPTPRHIYTSRALHDKTVCIKCLCGPKRQSEEEISAAVTLTSAAVQIIAEYGLSVVFNEAKCIRNKNCMKFVFDTYCKFYDKKIDVPKKASVTMIRYAIYNLSLEDFIVFSKKDIFRLIIIIKAIHDQDKILFLENGNFGENSNLSYIICKHKDIIKNIKNIYDYSNITKEKIRYLEDKIIKSKIVDKEDLKNIINLFLKIPRISADDRFILKIYKDNFLEEIKELWQSKGIFMRRNDLIRMVNAAGADKYRYRELLEWYTAADIDNEIKQIKEKIPCKKREVKYDNIEEND